MITIHKYKVELEEDFVITAPKGAHFLSVQVQQGEVQLWARVDTSLAAASYRFAVCGTGHALNSFAASAPHIGTFQMVQGSLVFHLFGGLYA